VSTPGQFATRARTTRSPRTTRTPGSRPRSRRRRPSRSGTFGAGAPEEHEIPKGRSRSVRSSTPTGRSGAY